MHRHGAGGRPLSPDVPTTAGVCPVHGAVEFRIHKVGFDKHGVQRYRPRCPACHAEEVRRDREEHSAAPTRTVVATDGSHTGTGGRRFAAGFAYVIDAQRYDFAPLAPEAHTELAAVRRALAAIDGPVTVILDSTEVYERLALGVPPRPKNAHRDAFLITREQVRERDVQFVLRTGDTGPPEHALAHYLAFLARLGQARTPGKDAPAADHILPAADPYAAASSLVHATLFPKTARS